MLGEEDEGGHGRKWDTHQGGEVLVVERLQALGFCIWPQERQHDGLLDPCLGPA